MKEEALRKKIDDHLELIKFSQKGMTEAPERATQFLIMVAVLTDEKRSSEEDKAKLSTVVSATYCEAMRTADGKNTTEKKIVAETETIYTEARETLEEIEAKISWLKTYINIFENAHLTYRQLSRE